MDLCDEAAPSAGLEISTRQFVSEPDGNSINLQVIRPELEETLACVYYIHGGGMASMSCFDGMYRGWGKLIAANGVAVVMVDFRNCLIPSSAPEVAPFPAGLNDCVSGLRWMAAHAAELGIDPARIVVAGESGGGNLTLATGLKLKRDGDLGLIKGLYALCPYIAGQWPAPGCPSSVENEGILLNLHNNRGAMGYGIEAFNERNPLAWPSFAGSDDVTGFPPTVISVNECDPLRDEGINFYRLLLAGGGTRPLPPDDGHHARHRDLLHRLSRHQPRHGPRHRRLQPATSATPPAACRRAGDRYARPPCATPGSLLDCCRALTAGCGGPRRVRRLARLVPTGGRVDAGRLARLGGTRRPGPREDQPHPRHRVRERGLSRPRSGRAPPPPT